VNQYYYKAAVWAYENGITTGSKVVGNDVYFAPNDTCTRAQVVTFLWRYENKPVVSSTSSFKDVAAGSYYADAVNWAVANGITTGMSSTTFQPNTTCSRAMVVTFLYRDLAK
jgi:cell wall assembly regulator SMI1